MKKTTLGLDRDGSNNSKAAPPGCSAAGTAPCGIPMTEVAKHNSKTDCWVVVDGQVLNVTSFLSAHPGGELVILAFAGKDDWNWHSTCYSDPRTASIRCQLTVIQFGSELQRPITFSSLSFNVRSLKDPIVTGCFSFRTASPLQVRLAPSKLIQSHAGHRPGSNDFQFMSPLTWGSADAHGHNNLRSCYLYGSVA